MFIQKNRRSYNVNCILKYYSLCLSKKKEQERCMGNLMKCVFIKQHDKADCAAACMAMVCAYYKKELSIASLRDMMGTDIKGTNMLGLSVCAQKLGFETEAIRINEEVFFSSFTLPAIANIVTEKGLSHFVVIYKITTKYVLVADPAKKIVRMPIDAFFSGFTGVMLLLAPTDEFKPQKEKKGKLVKRYLELIFPHKKVLLLSIIASVLVTGVGILMSIINNIIYDEIIPYRDVDRLLGVLLVFVGLAVTAAVVSFVRQWMLLLLSIKIDMPLMTNYFEHVFKLPMKFFMTRKIGEITTRFSDAFTVKNIFISIGLNSFLDVLMMIFSGIILFRLNAKLFLVQLIIIGINLLLVLAFKRPYKEINEEQMQQSAILNSEIIEGLRGIETIKQNVLEEKQLRDIREKYEATLKIGYRSGMLSNVQGLVSGIISQFGSIVLLYVGLVQVLNGYLTLGNYMAFMALANYFINPMNNMVGLQLSLQEANISMKRLAEILDYECEIKEEAISGNVPVAIEDKEIAINKDIIFDNVSFRYGVRQYALKNVSFKIPKGKKVALVGASGCGKTTILKLLLRYYTLEEGSIFVDDKDIKYMDIRTLRKMISYVPQTVELFSKTIWDNIVLSKPHATVEEVAAAVEKSGAGQFIQKSPMGIHTYLEEAGNGLSGGEKQRIALARAFLKDAPLYILDECTSNLDAETERSILDVIYNQLKDKTMLIVAHRLATVKNCDHIIVMDGGEIVEEGSHTQLLENRGKYFKLWKSQDLK